MPLVRAASAAAMAPSMLSYGQPGTIQMPSKPSRSSAPEMVEVCCQYSSIGSAGPASARISSGMRAWASMASDRSPTRARRGGGGAKNALMPAMVRVHLQKRKR
jgi:hypothetical protein